MDIKLMQPTDITPQVEQRINELMSQLNPSIKTEGLVNLTADASGCDVFCAFEGKEIMGMATLAFYKVLSGNKAWIEDVVVDQKFRRKGVAKALTHALIERAKERGADYLLLYTGTHRKEAHGLYESCGFILKNSHLYHLQL